MQFSFSIGFEKCSSRAVAADTTLMGEPEVRFGSGIVAMLAPYVTGPKQAKELLLIGDDRIPAERVLDMGILNRVVPEGTELDVALGLGRQIANASAKSVQLTKRMINRAYELANMREALAEALETDVQIEADESPERMEFNRIRAADGLKAALVWRDARAG